MPTQPTQTEGKDSGEAGRLGAQHENEHGDGGGALCVHGGDGEDDTEAEVDAENISGLEGGDSEKAAGEKAVEGVKALPDSEKIGYNLLGLEWDDKGWEYTNMTAHQCVQLPCRS